MKKLLSIGLIAGMFAINSPKVIKATDEIKGIADKTKTTTSAILEKPDDSLGIEIYSGYFKDLQSKGINIEKVNDKLIFNSSQDYTFLVYDQNYTQNNSPFSIKNNIKDTISITNQKLQDNSNNSKLYKILVNPMGHKTKVEIINIQDKKSIKTVFIFYIVKKENYYNILNQDLISFEKLENDTENSPYKIDWDGDFLFYLISKYKNIDYLENKSGITDDDYTEDRKIKSLIGKTVSIRTELAIKQDFKFIIKDTDIFGRCICISGEEFIPKRDGEIYIIPYKGIKPSSKFRRSFDLNYEKPVDFDLFKTQIEEIAKNTNKKITITGDFIQEIKIINYGKTNEKLNSNPEIFKYDNGFFTNINGQEDSYKLRYRELYEWLSK